MQRKIAELFSRFVGHLSDDDESNDSNSLKYSDSNQTSNSDLNLSTGTIGAKFTKYDYLLKTDKIDIKGLVDLSKELKNDVEILKNSYLPIVNSLVILNERRKKRKNRQQQFRIDSEIQQKEQSNISELNRDVSEDFLNSKVRLNFSKSEKSININNDEKSVWTIEKLCNPETRDEEFQRLFDSADEFYETVSKIKRRNISINYEKYLSLVKQGKDMLGFTELLNNNYNNNFLDIFRVS